jgi:hypothetical protein
LEGIFGVLFVTKDVAAYVQHQRAMSPHESSERRLIAPRHESMKQLTVAALLELRCDNVAEMMQDGSHGSGGHGSIPPESAVSL